MPKKILMAQAYENRMRSRPRVSCWSDEVLKYFGRRNVKVNAEMATDRRYCRRSPRLTWTIVLKTKKIKKSL